MELDALVSDELFVAEEGPEPERTVEDVMSAAGDVAEHHPIIHRVALTSGGGDSTVLAHRCVSFYDELCHIDTGTALPGVRGFVEEFARLVGKPLRIAEAGSDAFKELVLGADEWWPIFEEHRLEGEGPDDFRERVRLLPTREERMALGLHLAPLGFPGPAGHKFAYQRLKERQLEAALRTIKAEYGTGRRTQRVALLSGVRLDESARRKMTGAAQGEFERRGNQLWINPLLHWSNRQMRDYRQRHELPVSDVTALTHRSGECNCLAFAAPGEREELIAWYPEWYEWRILPIEEVARARGLKRWKWGWGPTKLLSRAPASPGPMCQDCQLTLAGLAE